MLLEKALHVKNCCRVTGFKTQNQNLEEEWEWKQKMVKRNKCDFGKRLCLTEQIFSMPCRKNTFNKLYFSSKDQEKGWEDEDKNLPN